MLVDYRQWQPANRERWLIPYHSDREERRRAAQQIMANPTHYYTNSVRFRHPEVDPAWIERTLIDPYAWEVQPNGRIRYWGPVPEVGNWLRVIVANGRLLNSFLDSSRRARWGRPS